MKTYASKWRRIMTLFNFLPPHTHTHTQTSEAGLTWPEALLHINVSPCPAIAAK